MNHRTCFLGYSKAWAYAVVPDDYAKPLVLKSSRRQAYKRKKLKDYYVLRRAKWNRPNKRKFGPGTLRAPKLKINLGACAETIYLLSETDA
jgi:hypothetical protein